MKNICLIFGGNSYENEVSVITTFFVEKVLISNFRLFTIYKKNNKFYICKKLLNFEKIANFAKSHFHEVFFCENGFVYKKSGRKVNVDCVINCCHGGEGENGAIAGMMECFGIPYTSAGVYPSSLFMDKCLTKVFLRYYKIPTLPFLSAIGEIDYSAVDKIGYPIVVKPARLGSSIGIDIAFNADELQKAIAFASGFDDKLLLEKGLTSFSELNCAAYKRGSEIIISEIEEIVNGSKLYDFGTKYIHNDVIRNIPADISEECKEKVIAYTRKIYEKAELEGVIRVDFLLDKIENKVYVNEVNVVPGSLAFYLFKKKGISFSELLFDLIQEGIEKAKAYQKEIPISPNGILLKMSEESFEDGVKK